MDWQEITTLFIVAATIILMIRKRFFNKKQIGKCNDDCNCQTNNQKHI